MNSFVPDSRHVTRVIPSPNHGDRRGRVINAVILHYTGMISAEAALARLCDPGPEVSAHYLVYEDGTIIQLVPEALRAWHAGRGIWQGESDMNSASVGIEIANPGHDSAQGGILPSFPTAQMMAVIALCQDIIARRNIRASHVLAHSDIAPGRKSDPGEAFPWAELARRGIGQWPQQTCNPDQSLRDPCGTDNRLAHGNQGASVTALQTKLAAIGYGINLSGDYDDQTIAVVTAFQRRYRPQNCDGVADAVTSALIDNLYHLSCPLA